jgi:Erythromycin esterase
MSAAWNAGWRWWLPHWRSSWNLRDRHMVGTLERLLQFYGPSSKAVVWAHNSHVGDVSATDFAARGELNVGQLCHRQFVEATYSIGFGTDHGTVAAASYWDGPMEVKQVRPSHPQSYERVFHEVGLGSFLLPLDKRTHLRLRGELMPARLERAIGVIYRPETGLASHYFHAVLPDQFDEYIWFDETRAVEPIATHELEGVPETGFDASRPPLEGIRGDQVRRTQDLRAAQVRAAFRTPGPAARRSFGADRLLRRTPVHAGASAARGAPRLLSERSLRRGTPFLALERVPHREVFACPTVSCRRVRRLAARCPWCSRRRAPGRRASRPPDAPHSSGSRSLLRRACSVLGLPDVVDLLAHECRAWVLEDFPLRLGRRARFRVSLFGSAESSFFRGRAQSSPVAPTRARR